MKNLSRKQVAWLNLRRVTEERLDKAIVKVINAYNPFSLITPRPEGERLTVGALRCVDDARRQISVGRLTTRLRYLAGGLPSAFLNIVMKAVTDS